MGDINNIQCFSIYFITLLLIRVVVLHLLEPDVKADGTHSSVGYEEVVKRLSESEEVLFDSNQPSKSFSDSAEHSHSWLTEKLLSAAFQPELPLKPENETTVSQSKLTDNGTHIKAADNKLSDKSTETLRLLNVFFKTKLVVSLLLGFIVRFCQTTVFGQTYIQVQKRTLLCKSFHVF